MTSKNLLRHPLARSNLAEMSSGSKFTRFYDEPAETAASLVSPEKIKKIIFCTGQVYYALLRAREANKIRDVVLTRVEQLSPFPFDLVTAALNRYPNSSQIVWCQEEPLNMGAWTHVSPRLETAMKASKNHASKRPSVVSRDPTAAVATGNKIQHVKEEQDILARALIGQSKEPKQVVQGVPIW